MYPIIEKVTLTVSYTKEPFEVMFDQVGNRGDPMAIIKDWRAFPIGREKYKVTLNSTWLVRIKNVRHGIVFLKLIEPRDVTPCN